MAVYTADDVKRLREATAAGMLDCKKALDEAEGNFDKAVEIIRVKGLKGVTKREGRTTSNGLVIAEAEGNLGVMIELNCETDFVAKGDRFQELAAELLAQLKATKLGELPAFLESKLANGKSVQELIDEGNATLGEKIELRRIAVLDGSPVALYLHRTSPDLPPQVGVLVQLASAAAEAGKDIAQHIAWFAPQFVRREDIPADNIENERRIAEETARAEGKPEASISKIVEGRVTGYVKEISLLEQAFAKDAKKTVQQIVDEAKTAVSAFHRFRVGQ
jgi:elongation factor Ts